MDQKKDIKVYVTVKVVFDEVGRMFPREIMWEDGIKYHIDRISDVTQAAAMRCGGQGDRYTIWIDGKSSYLYFERNGSLTGNNIGKWFVERRIA